MSSSRKGVSDTSKQPQRQSSNSSDQNEKNQQSNELARASFRPDAVRNIRKRTVFKRGGFNVREVKRPIWDLNRWILDLFTLLVEARWKWTLLIFAASSLLSWLLFAVVWWLLFFVHGDLQSQNMPPLQDQNNFTPCVFQIFDFTSAFLYSIETQSSIGYGDRMITEECPEGIFLMCFQIVVGTIIDGYFSGIVIAKLTRPRKRAKTIMFTHNAVISERDAKLCLMFRVADVQLKHLNGASVTLQMIHNKKTREGAVLHNYVTDLDVTADGCGPDLFFIWPFVLCHPIDEDSPLYGMPPSEMLQGDFELVVSLEGSHPTTGQDTKAMTSYLPHEILWGYKFEEVVYYDEEREGYKVDYGKFNSTVPVDTPLCSAEDLDECLKLERKGEKLDKEILKGTTEELIKLKSMATKES